MNRVINLTAVTLCITLGNLSAKPVFVRLESTNPIPPFADWATAATNLQQAVDAAVAGDQIIVTNGNYGAVNVNKPLSLRSVNGAKVTVIDAAHQGRCAVLTNGASLSGFWLRRGTAADSGGGVLCTSTDAFLTNCIITENSSTGGSGGGVWGGVLYNCLLSSNSAAGNGGGAMSGTLCGCTVVGNHSRSYGGGVYDSTATNCIVYFNTSVYGYGNHSLAGFNYSCTTPLPVNGMGNTTNAPQFVDYTAGDLRLLALSPGVGTGDNASAASGADLAGNPRIMRGTVDMGAYEFQGTNSMVFYSWVQHHGVVIDGTSDYEDPDGDGLNNWQEWVCYTCPTNMFKNLRLISAVPVGPHVVVRWESAAGVKYFVERSTSPTSPFTLVATDIVVNTGEAAYTNIFAAGPGPLYYRVGARAPTTQPAYLLCPVAAKPADPAYGLTYEGRAMTFCCADCKAVFQQAPTAYLTQIGLTPPSPEMAPPASTLFQFMMGSSDCTACDLGLRPPEPTPCPTPSPAETSSCCRPRSQPNPGE